MNKGEIVQTVKRLPGIPPVERGTRGKVGRVLGQWAFVYLANGQRIQVHEDDVSVLLKQDVARGGPGFQGNHHSKEETVAPLRGVQPSSRKSIVARSSYLNATKDL